MNLYGYGHHDIINNNSEYKKENFTDTEEVKID
jgi:hypothetical protein